MANITKDIHFRVANIKDVQQIYAVESQCFSQPWNLEAFYHELTKNRFALYLVIEIGNRIIGYCGAWIIIDEAHITNIAVLPQYRGKKLGEALLRNMMNKARQMGALTMTLEVRVSNTIAQSLYRKLGFVNGSIRKNYYTDNQEDALVMWVKL